jgi:hypothetical protein
VQGYVWAFPGGGAFGLRSRLAMFDGADIEALWLDVEQAGLSVADVDLALAVCDEIVGYLKTGVYSGRWFFAQQGWLAITKWSPRPLWDSNYTGDPTVGSGFKPYGGWSWPTITQYMGTSSVGNVDQIDLNVSALP